MRRPLNVQSASPGSVSTTDGPTLDQRAQWPTVIVSMPFVDVNRPSIQLGLLKAIGTRHGFQVDTLHAHLDFAVRIGVEFYRELSQYRGQQLGDWLFSAAAFGDRAPDLGAQLLSDFAGHPFDATRSIGDISEELRNVRDIEVPAFLDALLEAYPWDEVRVVGFTTTFQQNTASFALAGILKKRYPKILTLFGGANFDGGMGVELMRSNTFIDLAVSGEGDVAFPMLLSALAAGTQVAVIPGVISRDGHAVVVTAPAPPLINLDDLPVPDYVEYFDRADRLDLLPGNTSQTVPIPFESSRGCWWGAKHHCTFCGLNGAGMSFRSKSAQHIFDELGRLSRRHGSFHFEAVDNIIDVNHLKDLLPLLVEKQVDYQIFYEVKSNLRRDQLRLMAKAGVTHIQPGLESLSSNVLALMKKGVGAAQNVNLLRWAGYYGISVDWNILWGFPGETEQDYSEQAAHIPQLVHLQPPQSAGRIWMERFSPLFFDSVSFPVRSKAPQSSYRFVYPSSFNIGEIAYFFDYQLEESLDEHSYGSLRRAIQQWSVAWQAPFRPTLQYRSAPGFLQISDSRSPADQCSYTFTGAIADIYRAASDRPRTAASLQIAAAPQMGIGQVQEVIAEFVQRGLMFQDGALALALALPAIAGR